MNINTIINNRKSFKYKNKFEGYTHAIT